ncbi:hypothetical protein D9M69_372130 [compost metagenome]
MISTKRDEALGTQPPASTSGQGTFSRIASFPTHRCDVSVFSPRLSNLVRTFQQTFEDTPWALADEPQIAHLAEKCCLQRFDIRADRWVQRHQVETGLHLHAGKVRDAAVSW